jgi:hypothetical protein
MPAHESMETAKMLDDIKTGSQEEVISIPKNNLRANRMQFLRRHRFDRALGADRHESRSLNDSVPGRQASAASSRR